MGKENLKFGDIKIEKNKFYHYRNPVPLRDVDDIENVLVSNKISFGKENYEYFIGYLYNNNRIKPLHVMLLKTSTYVKSYDGQTKCMCFLIENDESLEKCNTVLG